MAEFVRQSVPRGGVDGLCSAKNAAELAAQRIAMINAKLAATGKIASTGVVCRVVACCEFIII